MNAREVMVKENCGMQPANRSEERRTGACRSFCWLNGKSVGQLSVDVAASIAPWLSAWRAATRDNASREVVAVEHDFHVVGHEGAQEGKRTANLVLRLKRLHDGEVSLGARRVGSRRAVLSPPRRCELRLFGEDGFHCLLFFTVRLHTSMIPCRIHLTCLLVHRQISGVSLT